MKRLILAVIFFLLLITCCSKGNVITPSQFTAEFAGTLRNTAPEFQVEVVRDLELKVVSKEGREFTCFLDNAYDNYKLDPKQKNAIIRRYVASGIETYSATVGGIDESRKTGN